MLLCFLKSQVVCLNSSHFRGYKDISFALLKVLNKRHVSDIFFQLFEQFLPVRQQVTSKYQNDCYNRLVRDFIDKSLLHFFSGLKTLQCVDQNARLVTCKRFHKSSGLIQLTQAFFRPNIILQTWVILFSLNIRNSFFSFVGQTCQQEKN